jgi:hypothetical protein
LEIQHHTAFLNSVPRPAPTNKPMKHGGGRDPVSRSSLSLSASSLLELLEQFGASLLGPAMQFNADGLHEFSCVSPHVAGHDNSF